MTCEITHGNAKAWIWIQRVERSKRNKNEKRKIIKRINGGRGGEGGGHHDFAKVRKQQKANRERL